MDKLEDLGEVISTDLLIVGGGFGGLVSAIKAKEGFPDVDVLIVDRETIGWAGKAPKGGGFFVVFTPDQDPDKFVEYHVKNIGIYLENRELLYAYAREAYGTVEQLANWGVYVDKNAEGKINVVKNDFNGLWSYAGADLNMQLPLRARARKLGAKIMNKIEVVELLKQGDRVIGAVGFNVLDGRFYIFKAKAVMLVNGSCNYRARRMWAAASGDGIAAAYRAGAEMRNAEFGNCCPDLVIKDTEGNADRRFIFNALGENLSIRYEPEPHADMPLDLLLSVERELREGRGPVYEDLSKMPPGTPPSYAQREMWKRPHFDALWNRLASKYEVTQKKREVTIRVHAELSPVKVDNDMKTTLEGLWAIGDTCYDGSAMAGAIAAPPGKMRGSGLGYAVFSALRGAPPAAQFAASKASAPEVDHAEVTRLKEDIFAPMKRNKGLSPGDAISLIQDAVLPVQYSLRRSKTRLEEALSKIEEIKQRLQQLYAKDGHGLCKCIQAKSMTLLAEMTFRAALMRTESRGWHYREDYPDRDDKNWLKWVIIKQEPGRMVLSTEPVPIGR
jgi:succinate dehydrogenase/fumarate reductase flavoprotein subunit